MTIDPLEDAELQAPILPQSRDGIIDIAQIYQKYIFVNIALYYNISRGDIITAYFGDFASTPFVVTDPVSPIIIQYDKDKIPNGSYGVTYVATRVSGNQTKSDATDVKVVNSLSNYLSRPIFPDYPNNVIGIQSIIDNSYSLKTTAKYSTMALGDIVHFFYRGTDAYGNNVPNTYQKSSAIVVTQADIDKQSVDYTYSNRSLDLLGNSGFIFAYYSVITKNFQTSMESSENSAIILWNDLKGIICSNTNHAPFSSVDLANIHASNTACVMGPPGAIIDVDVSEPFIITEAGEAEKTYELTINQNGFGYFSVYTAREVYNQSAYVNLKPKDNKLQSIVARMDFNCFSNMSNDPTEAIQAYGYRTHAVADGKMACSIYLKLAPDIKNIHAWIKDGALINGSSSNYISPINEDGAATLNIVTNIAGEYTISINTIPRSTGELIVNTLFIPKNYI